VAFEFGILIFSAGTIIGGALSMQNADQFGTTTLSLKKLSLVAGQISLILSRLLSFQRVKKAK